MLKFNMHFIECISLQKQTLKSYNFTLTIYDKKTPVSN